MKPSVSFVVAPFLPEHQPALGVSSLVATLATAGIAADARYLNLDFARTHGFALSSHLGGGLPVELLLGEMVFVRALWGDAAPKWDDYAERLRGWYASGHARHRRPPNLDDIVAAAAPLHERAVETVEAWADEIAADAPRVVGFTTTFQQNVAALALARALRRRLPPERLAILFGGANCEADMGRALASNFPFVDHVVSGEGELVIVDLVRDIVEGAPAWPRYVPGRIVQDMDALPQPVFDHYVDAVRGTEMAAHYNLAAESSRGCWWGMKSHCTFCGLNGGTMAYRRKSPSRFQGELKSLKESYGSKAFMLADNIMDMKYVSTLFPQLIAAGDDVELFYETKANLRKSQLEMMVAGGVARLQPGIESLSTPILKLMGKGTTALQNLQVLKWCEEFKVGLAWNVLTGFPGEPPEEYDAMAALIPMIVHLPAPTGLGAIRMDRFSPYWKSPADYRLGRMRPFWTYDVVYGPLPPAERARLAYFFDFDYPPDQRPPESYSAGAFAALAGWRRAYAKGATLEVIATDGGFRVRDTRGWRGEADAAAAETPIGAAEAAVLRRLDSCANADALTSIVPDPDDLRRILSTMSERGWIAREGDLFLSLVLDRSERERVTRRRIQLRLAEFGLDDLAGSAALAGDMAHDGRPEAAHAG